MPPNASSSSPHIQEQYESDEAHLECPKELQAKIAAETRAISGKFGVPEKVQKKKKWYQLETDIIWLNAIALISLHVIGLYHFITFPYIQKWKLFAVGYFCGMVGGFGVTAGVHRYWTHRSYKANLPFRIILMICYLSSGQNSIAAWVRDHRVHHKFSETDADPHNSNRGFFFAHMGWLMMRKHPEVIRKGKEIDMSDVLSDPVVAFAQKHFTVLRILLGVVVPTLIPRYLMNESWYYSIVTMCFIRYILLLNFTWSVNSAAHIWGNKPYDKNISPVENRAVSFMAMGEGWHNYHHVFPWDYKAAELGNYRLNFTTAVIDFFAHLGWVYDRKQPSKSLVRAIAENRGDGSHRIQEVAEPNTCENEYLRKLYG
ncbi:hypothetical protein QAD02_010978 [Eretmocerus hayati]|uniref:Uncharacterized protein n=1 Tax=Eretmocerus hayati TaxID=131215 RepID=A0ACC2NYC1_9HYME|nr:hypothetical protein QAD02_010978 [Eretmocerus hayati]